MIPNFTPTKLNRANVTKGRRVTLPPLLVELEENDQLVFAKTETEGVYIFKKINPIVHNAGIRMILYAAVIGQSVGNGRWYGIIIDANGLIKLRINASSEYYLRKDLTELTDTKYRDKLNFKCGINQWHMPVLITDGFQQKLSDRIINTIRECAFGLNNGSWPPE
jgi:hypothetical protein